MRAAGKDVKTAFFLDDRPAAFLFYEMSSSSHSNGGGHQGRSMKGGKNIYQTDYIAA